MFPCESIATLPTPVTSFDVSTIPGELASLHIKRDDQTAAPFGGNKIRKLEFILGEAREEGRREIITFGFAGSNHCVATARAAHAMGMHTTSLLLPQTPTPYVAQNLALGLEAGATLVHRRTTAGLVVALAKAWLTGLARDKVAPKVVPAGGSSSLGMIGYVNAGLELAEQISEGDCPRPDALYVALGSGGTAVGLQAGLALAGMDVKVVSVLVVEGRYMSAAKLARKQRQLASFLAARGLSLPVSREALSTRVREEFFGPGYGEPTSESEEAREIAETQGDAFLDAAYTSKGFAALLADARAGALRDRHVVFWHTYGGPRQASSTPPFEGTASIDMERVPRSLRMYFESARR